MKTLPLRQFQVYNPFRSPSWRFDRVLSLVDHQPKPLRASRKYDDEYVRKYRQFLLKWRENVEKDQQDDWIKLFRKDPAMYYAHLISIDSDPEWKSILQAKILAGLDDAELAGDIGTLPETVELYEKLFFNVRDRLRDHTYIVKTVLGVTSRRDGGFNDTFNDSRRDLCYKLFAYFGGPIVLDIVVSGFSNAPIPNSRQKAEQWLDQAMKTAVRRRSSMAAQVFEVNKFNVLQLMELQCRIIEAEQVDARSGSGESSNDQLGETVEELLEGLDWTFGKRVQESMNDSQKKFASTSVEPRAEEVLELSANRIPGSLQQTEQLKLPQTRQNTDTNNHES